MSLASGLGVERRVGQAEQVLGLLAGFVPGRGAADGVRNASADQGRPRRLVGAVGRLRRSRDQAFDEPGTAQADDVHQVAGLQSGEPDLDAPGRLFGDDQDLASVLGAFVHQQGAGVTLHDRSHHPADLRPYTVSDRVTDIIAFDNCPIALPERCGGYRTAAPGRRGGGQGQPLFPARGLQNQDVRANIEHSTNNCVCRVAVHEVGRSPREVVLAAVRRAEDGGLEPSAASKACGTNSVRDIIDGRAASVPTAHLPPMGLHNLPLKMLTVGGLRQANPEPFCKVYSETHSHFFE